jgi:hypothetical protein
MTPREALAAEAARHILLFDGAYGTEIQARRLGEADFAGELGLSADQKGNNDILALTHPDVVAAITRAYLEAGSDIVSTNTFSANRISQADYAAQDIVAGINLAAARIAREAQIRDLRAAPARARGTARAPCPCPARLQRRTDARMADRERFRAVIADRVRTFRQCRATPSEPDRRSLRSTPACLLPANLAPLNGRGPQRRCETHPAS